MFRFYITDLLDGQVVGSNDEAVAADMAQSEDFFVVDTQTAEWLHTNGREAIQEYQP